MRGLARGRAPSCARRPPPIRAPRQTDNNQGPHLLLLEELQVTVVVVLGALLGRLEGVARSGGERRASARGERAGDAPARARARDMPRCAARLEGPAQPGALSSACCRPGWSMHGRGRCSPRAASSAPAVARRPAMLCCCTASAAASCAQRPAFSGLALPASFPGIFLQRPRQGRPETRSAPQALEDRLHGLHEDETSSKKATGSRCQLAH